jgi:hypothetical protein
MHRRTLGLMCFFVVALMVGITAGVASAQGPHWVSGVVRDHQGGAASGVEIRFYDDAALNSLSPLATCVSSADGRYECAVAAGEYYVAAFPDPETWLAIQFFDSSNPAGPGQQKIDVSGDVDGIDFDLIRGGRMSFSILDSAQNPVDFDVYVFVQYEAPSAGSWWDNAGFDTATGTYTGSVFPPGRFVVGLSPSDSQNYASNQYYCGVTQPQVATRIEILDGETAYLADCELLGLEVEDAAISGTVRDESGVGVRGVSINARLDRASVVSSAVTDREGNYTIELESGLSVVIEAVPPAESWLVAQVHPSGRDFEDGILVPAGTDGVDFMLETGGRLEFDLVDPDGLPIGFELPIMVSRRTTPGINQWVTYWWTFTDATGAFSDVLPAGDIKVLLNPVGDTPYRTPQGLCERYVFTNADVFTVNRMGTTQVSACPLALDYSPRTSAGYLFTFDRLWLPTVDSRENWSGNQAAVGDLNNDGLVDIVTSFADDNPEPPTHLCHRYTVFENQGNNTFRDAAAKWVPPEHLMECLPVGDVEIADMDCDGFVDVVLGVYGEPLDQTQPWGGPDMIWRNIDGQRFEDFSDQWMHQEDPTLYGFSPQEAIGWTTHSLSLGDLDADGDIDLFRGGIEPALLNDGAGVMSLAPPSTAISGYVGQDALEGAWGMDLGDLNGDGHVDVFMAGYVGYLQTDGEPGFHYILVGRGDGSFEPVPAELTPPLHEGPDVVAYHPFIHDFDGDDQPEVYVSNWAFIYQEDPDWGRMDFGPLDQYLDFQAVQNGWPLFADATDQIEQSREENLSWFGVDADIDNDGDQDVLVPNISFGLSDYTHPEVRILINDGAGYLERLSKNALPPFLATPTRAFVLDSENDGDWDIYLVNNFPHGHILLVNLLLEKHDLNSDGFVTLGDAAEVQAVLGSVAEGDPEDLNGDGVVDARDLSLVLRYQTTVRADNDDLVPKCSKGAQ